MKTGFRRFGSLVAIVLVVALNLSAVSLAADKRTITETDLFKFVWIADPQISPDGSQVVFVREWVNQKADRYDTALWIVTTTGDPGGEKARQLTAGPRDGSPRWSPDGKTIAFIRSIDKDGKPQPPQIWLLSLGGGEAQPLTDAPRSPGGFEWSPDGKTIAFMSREDASKEKEKPNPEEAEAKDKPPEHVSDVRVITKAVYRFNGGGYLNPKSHGHIWTVTVPVTAGEKPKPRQLTKGNFDEGNINWSHDGSRIYFVANRVAEPYYEAAHTDLYSISASGSNAGGDERKMLSFDGGMRRLHFQQRRQTHRVRRRAGSQARAVVHTARSIRDEQ